MRRREFIALIGWAAALPIAARGQQGGPPVQRIGILMGYAESDPEAQRRLAGFTKGLERLGWTEGTNLRIDYRWTAGDIRKLGNFARELVSLQPKVILSNTTPVTAAVQRETQEIPIVFVMVSDPIGSGFVKTLAHPGGNITGFINLESSLVEKWPELLKELVPSIARVSLMFNPETAPYAEYYLLPIEAAAPKMGVEAVAAPVHSESDIRNVITQLARDPGAGLVVMIDSYMFVHRKAIIELTARHKVPAIHYARDLVSEGGLISYGVDSTDLFRRAAPYVDRILRGATPAELPVQQPTKFELVINLKTAAALGITVPPSLLARADEVIE